MNRHTRRASRVAAFKPTKPSFKPSPPRTPPKRPHVNTPPETEERRTTFVQPISKKDIQDGDAVATCGHVTPGSVAYTFDVCIQHEGADVAFLACCEACASASNYDVAKVAIVEVVTFGHGPS